MCGFVGFCEFDHTPHAMNILSDMTNSLSHRGPDSSGLWAHPNFGIWLGHRRLSILDLSESGGQPMVSETGRYTLVFNGEIYNHLLIREQINNKLIGKEWHGSSDTETILAAIELWGIPKTLIELTGMFSFAVWDNKLEQLTLARDRFGEKPLYYGWQSEGQKSVFLFGSELKALRVHPKFQHVIDRGALSLYLRHNYVPSPYSIFKGISKLPAGTFLILKKDNFQGSSVSAPEAYWSLANQVNDKDKKGVQINERESVKELDLRLTNVIEQQMISDVPIGAFLSGGVDSSVIVSLMQKQSEKKVKTFSIGFNQSGFNEAEYAKAVATHLGTEHTELYVEPSDALSVIPSLPSIYDEPFADSSQIPTFLVSKLAKEHVTVALSGDAGDELFCGYNRYLMTDKMWHRLKKIPVSLRAFGATFLRTVSPDTWNAIGKIIPIINNYPNIGDKLHKGANVLCAGSNHELYIALVSQWHNPSACVINGWEKPTYLTDHQPSVQGISDIEKMMFLDTLTYLPDDILTKVDRAAMANSLETRVPFLDHHLAEFVWSLPESFKLRDGETKWILRRVLEQYIPNRLIDRPKMGFGVPISDWLRGPLRDWADNLLNGEKLRTQGYFDSKSVADKWSEHLSGTRNWSGQLWCILMFQAWLEKDEYL